MATFKGWGNERKNAVDWGKPILPAIGDALVWMPREVGRRAEDAARAGRDRALGEDFFARVAPQVEELPMAPEVAMPMQMAPAPMAPTAVGGGYVPGSATDRFMVDAPAKPMAPWPEDWSDLPTAGELPEAPPAPTTGVFRGGRPWTPTAPGAMGADEYAADVAGRAAGRRASAGYDRDVRANAALSERIGKMGAALGQPIAQGKWDEYNQRTRENAMRMGIGAPDPENDRDMAVWAQGQTNVAGQMRRSPQERAEARGGADRYRQEQEAGRDREAQVRIADAEREGEWTTDPTGQTAINKRTGETRPTGATGRPQRHVVGRKLVDQDGKVLFDGTNGDERIEGYTWDEFMDLEKQSWNFTGKTLERFEALRNKFYDAAEKRGREKAKPAAAEGGGGGGGFRVFK